MRHNGYYVEGEDRASRVSALFSSIASKYDLINDLQSFFLHRYWKHYAVTLLKPQSHLKALDICCGTGDVAELLASKELTTVGLDFNQDMLNLAKARSESFSIKFPGLKPAEYLLGDALSLPFGDASFDRVSMSYGLRNLASFENGISEMMRVLKPGGRFTILDFSRPNNQTLRKLYFSYLSISVPLLGMIVAGDKSAYDYILESLIKYPSPTTIEKFLLDHGADKVHCHSFLAGVMTIHSGQK